MKKVEISFVELFARFRGVKIVSFYLSCLSWNDQLPTSSDVDSWLLFAVEKQVEDLYVGFGHFSDAQFCPPQRLYSCSSITELHLCCCCLLEIEGSVQWNRLKSLWIKVPDSSCDESISKILLGAPILEEMQLYIEVINENFSIRSTSLKKLIIDHINMPDNNVYIMAKLRIWAPNLLTLHISADVVNGGSFLFDVPSLTYASFGRFCDQLYDVPPLKTFYHLLRSICHVKKVKLSESNIKFLLAMKKKDMVVQFPNAKYLRQESKEAWGQLDLLELLDLLEMFPKLKMLQFSQYQNMEDFDPIVRTTFPRPSLLHLNTVESTWPIQDPSLIPFIEFLLQNAPLLHKLMFRLTLCDRNSLLMVEEKVRSMPRSSPTVEVIITDRFD